MDHDEDAIDAFPENSAHSSGSYPSVSADNDSHSLTASSATLDNNSEMSCQTSDNVKNKLVKEQEDQ